MDCQIYLIPGFFGFSAFGSYNYFNGIRDILDARLREEHGINAAIFNCKTKPTASLTSRANATVDEVVATGGLKAKALHFIGHSTGGLDARLMLTPGVKLRKDTAEKRIAKKTLSLTTVSTPHYGTPIAGFLTTLQGRHILNILTALANNKRGRQGIYWSAQAAKIVSRIDDYLGFDNTILDEIAKNFLKELTMDSSDPFWNYLKKVQDDQGALIQLTPEGMDLFNAAVVNSSSIDYKSVVSATQRPRIAGIFPKLLVPTLAGSMTLFYILREITARAHKAYPYPDLSELNRKFFDEELSFPVNGKTNDGVSPCLSQIHGKLILASEADHLDIVGQYARKGENEKYSDWLVSGSKFNEAEFIRVWQTVADEIALSQERGQGPGENKKSSPRQNL